jgi:RecA/RadA recombinase
MLPESLTKGLGVKLYRATDSFWDTTCLQCGIAPVDYALRGGFGDGRLGEIFGNWSSGKTMLLYKFLAANQKRKSPTGKPGHSILFESEGAFTPEFFEALGGNPEQLQVAPVDQIEGLFDAIKALCDNIIKTGDNTPLCIGWDGIAATGTKHLVEVGMDKRDMSMSAGMTQGCKLITTVVRKAKVCVIATNQTRELIGSMDTATHTPGGRGYPFHASQRLELQFDGGSKTSVIMDSDEQVKLGRWTRGEVVKNKLGSPFGKFSLPILLYEGLDHPEFNRRQTHIGIDTEWALFSFYKNQDVHKIRVLTQPSSGWWQLHQRFGSEKFRKSEWCQVLERHPALWQFPYQPPAETTSNATSA